MKNEPVAWMSSVGGEFVYVGYEPAEGYLAIPLYTHPADLTDEEIQDLWAEMDWSGQPELEFARAILKKASEK